MNSSICFRFRTLINSFQEVSVLLVHLNHTQLTTGEKEVVQPCFLICMWILHVRIVKILKPGRPKNCCNYPKHLWVVSWQNQQNDCAPSEDSDQPGHPPSLIRVFAVRMKKARGLSYPMSALRRFWSDWADAQADLSLRWAHSSFCRFCHEAALMCQNDRDTVCPDLSIRKLIIIKVYWNQIVWTTGITLNNARKC